MTHMEYSLQTNPHTSAEDVSLDAEVDALILSLLAERQASAGVRHIKKFVAPKVTPYKLHVNIFQKKIRVSAVNRKFSDLESALIYELVKRKRLTPSNLYEYKVPSAQELIESASFREPDPLVMKLRMRTVDAVMNGTEWFKGKYVGLRADPESRNPHSLVSRWIQRGEIFFLERGGVKFFPNYIFDEIGSPLPVVKEILKVFENRSAFRIASWFESTSSALGGKRPRELVKSDPDRVLEAARDSVMGVLHG